MDASRYRDYRRAVLRTLAAYRERHFAEQDSLFEPGPYGEPAFTPEAAHRNLFDSALYHALTQRPAALRSLSSSRALTISVLGTLARREDLRLLADVPCDDRRPVLPSVHEAEGLSLELQRTLLAPPRCPPARVDVSLQGRTSGIAVVGRLLQPDLGALPWLPRPQDRKRCLALVVYDVRNPAWAPGRVLRERVADRQHEIEPPNSLRLCTWQALAAAMARSGWYADLLEWMGEKYGIGGQ